MSFNSGTRRSRGKRAVRVALYGLAAAHLAEAALLRRRRRNLRALPGRSVDGTAAAPEDVELVTAVGVEVDAATAAEAFREMEATEVEVIDLVPGDLPAVRALRLLRRVDPDQLGRDPLASPGGAHEALALHRSVAERLASRPDGAGRTDGGSVSPGSLARFTKLAQRYAPARSVLRVAPGLRAGPRTSRDRWQELHEIVVFRGDTTPARALLGLETGHLLALTAGCFVAPVAGGAALATWCLQPVLVFGGGAGRESQLRPPDLTWPTLLRRLPDAWRENLAATAAGRQEVKAAQSDRPEGPVFASPPEAELFDPRRETCPWCGSADLVGVLDAGDMVGQGKPGTFHLDECRACGHVFQNPALSLRGLDHYYDQAYEGDGEESSEKVFGSLGRIDRLRVQAISQFTEPTAWLDVGTGHGHFCAYARHELPDTVFDGLDIGPTVEEGQRRGWVDTAYRGLFPDLAEGLPRSYDVVSMHHYLEHTRDPRRELGAAAKVLEPGGYLMIEVPDAESPWSRRLGRFWLPWFQPQHQHFIPCANLQVALAEAGFEVVSVERGAANMGGLDLGAGSGVFVAELAGKPPSPWREASDAGHPIRRAAVTAVAAPAMAVALVADFARDAWLRGPGKAKPGNTYRVVARRL